MFVVSGCYEVVYTAEYKGDSCIKFEDAMYDQDPDPELEDWVDACLGEDGAVEVDLFAVEVDGDVESIDVALKAGKCTEDGTIDLSDPLALDLCSFIVVLEDSEDTDDGVIYYFSVMSDDIEGGKGGTAALSNITFCFGDGVTIISPEEGEFPTSRLEEEDIDD
jgi:hypothetical protein